MSTFSGSPRPVPPLGDPTYPTSDGRPIAETDWHRNVLADTIETLNWHFRGQRAYVTGALLVFYREGDRATFVTPDLFVVRGLEQRDRLNYLLWQEGLPPNVVIEITSASTRIEDIEEKLPLYRDTIGVAELFLFDPRQEYLCPSLQGHRLDNGQYLPIAPLDGRLPSEQLGLHLEAEKTQLRFFDPVNGRRLLTWRERCQIADEAARKAEVTNRYSSSDDRV